MAVDILAFFAIPVQITATKKELEEQIWQNIGQDLSNYISKNLNDLKKK